VTVAGLRATSVIVQVVPFTFEHTALRETQVGDGVNIEADVIGKYVARVLDRLHAGARSMEAASLDPAGTSTR
jgi:riboflavin synthase